MEAAEASKLASYNRRVEETEAWLAEELAEVWVKVLNRARVPVTSEWRLAENVFYFEDIREVPAALPPSTILASQP